MPDVTDRLRALPTLLADDAPSSAEIARRGLRRRRRRSLVIGGVVVLTLLAGVAVALPSGGSSDPDSVRAGPSSPPTALGAEGITLSPPGPVTPGATVTLVLDDPPPDGTPWQAYQCPREALAFDAPIAGTCRGLSATTPDELQVVVQRLLDIEESHRNIDCAEEPGRCVLRVWVGHQPFAEEHVVPLTFVEGLASLTTPTIHAPTPAAEGYRDARPVTFTVRGLQPGEEVRADQCLQSEVPICDASASSARATASDAGVAQVPVLLYHDIFVGRDQWAFTACAPCEVRFSPTTSDRPDPVPVEMAPTPMPTRPRVRVEPPGPHAPGATVALVGSGFRRRREHRAEVRIGWCPAQSTPGESCTYSSTGDDIDVSSDGTFRIERFRLPGPDASVYLPYEGETLCTTRPGVCALAWQPTAGSPYAVIVPLDLSG